MVNWMKIKTPAMLSVMVMVNIWIGTWGGGKTPLFCLRRRCQLVLACNCLLDELPPVECNLYVGWED